LKYTTFSPNWQVSTIAENAFWGEIAIFSSITTVGAFQEAADLKESERISFISFDID